MRILGTVSIDLGGEVVTALRDGGEFALAASITGV
jgi:hypothetical protein